MIREDETLEDLPSVNCKIIQKKSGFRFTVDSILLVNFLKLKKNTDLLDIGTGTGIMPLLLSKKEELSKIVAVEIENEIAEMFGRTLEINGLHEKIKLQNTDIRKFKHEAFDYIISNPPYMKLNEGYISPHDYRAGARHEVNLNLKDLLVNAKKLLKNGGSLNLIYRTNRFMELLDEAKTLNLNPKRVRFIYSKINQNSDLFMIELIKGFKCSCVVEEPLYIYDKYGEYTEELKKYYE